MRHSQHSLEEELRRRIREGVYPPGMRLPTHRSLLLELGASSVTLQRAFTRLVDQGYVERHRSRGSFVARNLPHRSTLAMVFPDEPGERGWNRFWSTARRVVEEWNEGDVRFRVYCITGQRSDSAAHRRLCRDVADGGLAGIVFINAPYYIQGSPVFARPLPRVCIGGSERDDTAYGCSIVTLVDDDIPARIMRRFQSAGRRRLAALAELSTIASMQRRYQSLLRAMGMETRREWWLGLPVDPAGAASARTVTHLLLSGSERQRPDCLLIADDNLVPHATAGILDAGIRIPETLSVGAHANYPGPTSAAVPCLRFGPDMTTQVRAAVAEIAALATGGRPRVIKVPFEIHDS